MAIAYSLNKEDSSDPRHVRFRADLRSTDSTSPQPDPAQYVRFRVATRRMGYWPSEYKTVLKAQAARDMRGEVTYGPRLPNSFTADGHEFILEGRIIDGARRLKSAAAGAAAKTILVTDGKELLS